MRTYITERTSRQCRDNFEEDRFNKGTSFSHRPLWASVALLRRYGLLELSVFRGLSCLGRRQ